MYCYLLIGYLVSVINENYIHFDTSIQKVLTKFNTSTFGFVINLYLPIKIRSFRTKFFHHEVLTQLMLSIQYYCLLFLNNFNFKQSPHKIIAKKEKEIKTCKFCKFKSCFFVIIHLITLTLLNNSVRAKSSFPWNGRIEDEDKKFSN